MSTGTQSFLEFSSERINNRLFFNGYVKSELHFVLVQTYINSFCFCASLLKVHAKTTKAFLRTFEVEESNCSGWWTLLTVLVKQRKICIKIKLIVKHLLSSSSKNCCLIVAFIKSTIVDSKWWNKKIYVSINVYCQN